ASMTLAPNARRLATPKGRSQSPRRAATRTTQAPTRSLRSRAGKPKNLAGRLFRIDPIVRLKQTLVEQSAHQLVQVSAQLLLRDVILGEERIKDSVVIGQFLDQRPHTGADRVEAEIRPALQIEDHCLALEVPVDDVFGDTEATRTHRAGLTTCFSKSA